MQQAQATTFPGKLPAAPEEPEEEELAAAIFRRKLSQTGQIVISSTSTDLSCVGCDTSDTRVQVNPTTTYPHTALGQLIGDLPDSTSCVPSYLCPLCMHAAACQFQFLQKEKKDKMDRLKEFNKGPYLIIKEVVAAY